MNKAKHNIAFLSHGGGPMPLLDQAEHGALVDGLRRVRAQLPNRPVAILVISAHWETRGFAITAQQQPNLVFDYSGFPPETYEYQYPAPGAPLLAQQLQTALGTKGIELALDASRGFDHGVFVPLMLAYPDANIPVLQLSIDRRLAPEQHLALGRALAEVLPEDVLVLGSGFTFHNLPAFFSQKETQLVEAAQSFNQWLIQTLRIEAGANRQERLANWSEAPFARLCHPREEHLIPLLVCAGMAAKPAQVVEFDVMGLPACHFVWPIGK